MSFFLNNLAIFDALVDLISNAACQASLFKGLVNLSNTQTFLRLMVKKNAIEHCVNAILDPNFGSV